MLLTHQKILNILENEKDYILDCSLDEKKYNDKIAIKHLVCKNVWNIVPKNFINGRRCPNKECLEARKKKTNLKKYGSEWAIASASIQDKIKKTNLVKYGVENQLLRKEIHDKARETNIKKYGVENVSQNSAIREKQKKTNLKQYGKESPLSSPEIQDKIKKTNLERYGVENPWQSEEVRKKSKFQSPFGDPQIQEQIRNIFLKKYGEKYYCSTKEFKKQISQIRLVKSYDNFLLNCKSKNIEPLFSFEDWNGHCKQKYDFICLNCNTKFCQRIDGGHHDYKMSAICRKCNPPLARKYLQEEFEAFFKELKVKYEFDKMFLFDDGVRREIDIFLPDMNIGFELNGVFWHSFIGGNKSADYHIDKTRRFLKIGIKVFHIFDIEWNMKKNLVQSMIKSKIGLYENKIFARKCSIKALDKNEERNFLESNHIQGYINSNICYGLIYENRIVAVASFGSSRYNKNFDFELLRFANEQNSQVIGGFSRLLKHYKKTNPNKTLISYADRRFSFGEVYEKNGFILLGSSSPNYFYTKNYNELFSRIKFQKHKLKEIFQNNFDETKSEWENMKNNGWDKIYDCGNLVYILDD